MDKDEKRRLKKLGKQVVEQRSEDLQQRLREANPAPVGSGEWVENYRQEVTREQLLRADPPDRMSPEQAASAFVVNPVEQDLLANLIPVRTWYLECLSCGFLVHTAATHLTQCHCGNVVLDVSEARLSVRSRDHVRVVKLIGRA